MFRDIVSNLSFSPAASSQLSFYWRRLKKEQVTRQLSMVMAGALVVIQVATIIAPPDPANATSSNDLIPGGINTGHPQATMLSEYDHRPALRALFLHYGVTRSDIANTKHGSLKSTDRDNQLRSLGRNRHLASDGVVQAGGETFYIRRLSSWDTHGPSAYQALEGHRKVDGQYFAILYNCGNLVITHNVATPKPTPTPKPQPVIPGKPVLPQATPQAPTPVAPVVTPPVTPGSPNITLSKSAKLISAADGSSRDANTATAQPGDLIEYTLTTTNTGNAPAKDYIVTENLNDVLEYADLTDPREGVLAEGTLSWPKVTIAPNESHVTSFQVRVKSPLPTTPTSTSDPKSFDLKMDNIYGNLVTVNLTVPLQKQVEVQSAALPATGPRTGTIIVLLLASAIGYFYFRNRQLVQEVSMLRGDHHGHGGGQ